MDDIVNSPAAANGRAYKYARLDQLPGSNAVSGLSALAQEGLLHEVDPKLFSRDLLMTKDSRNTTFAHLLAREKAVVEFPDEMFRPEVLMDRDQFDSTVFHTLARTGKLDRVPDGMLTPEVLMERDRFGTVLDAAALNGSLDQIPPTAWQPESLEMKPLLERRGDGSTVAETLVNKFSDYVRVGMNAFSEEVRAGLVSAVISEAGSRAYHLSVPLNQTSPTLTAVSMLNELSQRLGTRPSYEAIEAKLNTRDWADDMGWKAAGAVLTRKRELDDLLSTGVDTRGPLPDNVLAPLLKTPLDESGKKGVPFDTAQAAAVNLSEVLQNVQFTVVQSPEDLREAINGTNEARILRAQGLYEPRQNGKPGIVWIIADNVIVRKGETPEGAVERVGFHEAAGHHGIRKVLGDKAEATFERVYEWAKASQSAEVRSLFDAVTSSEDYRDLSKAAQADEILARLQENRQHKDLSFWERSMGAVCQMVGQHLPQMKFSTVECEYLLWQARVEAMREPDKQALFKSDMEAQVDFFKLQASKLHIAVREASLDQIGEWSAMFRSQNPRFSASGKLLYSLPLTAPRQDVDFRPSEIPEWQAAASTGELFRVIRPGEDLPLSGFCRSQAAAVIDAAPVRFDDIEVTQVHAKESLNVLFQDLPWKTTSHEMWNIVERYGGPDTALGTMVLNAYQPSNNGLPDGYAVRAPSQNIGGRQMPGIPKIFDPNGDQVFAGELGQKPLDAVFAFASHNDLMGKEALKLNPDNLVVDELVGRDSAFVSEVRALGFDAVQVTDDRGKESRLNIVDRNAVDFATRTPSAEEITDSLLPEPAVEKNTFARKPVKLHGKDEEIEAFHSSAERSFALVAATHAAEKLGIMDEQQEAHFFGRLERLAGNTLDYHDFTGRVVLGDHAEEIGKSFGAIAAHNAEGLATTVQAIAGDILSAKEKEGARSQLEGAGLNRSRITAIASETPDPWNEPDLPPSIFMSPPTPGCGPEM